MQHGCNNDSTAPSTPARSSWLDRVGIGVSITCAIHCIGAALLAAAPAFAASASPALGERFEAAEGALLWVALGVGALALVPAYLRDHRNPAPLGLFGGGIALLAASRAFEAGGLEIAVTVAGVALVASAHLVNLRVHRHRHAH